MLRVLLPFGLPETNRNRQSEYGRETSKVREYGKPSESKTQVPAHDILVFDVFVSISSLSNHVRWTMEHHSSVAVT